MTVPKEGIALVAQARKLAARWPDQWNVEDSGGRKSRQDWRYRIVCPPGTGTGAEGRLRIPIHESPSDHRWLANTTADLRRVGFAEAVNELSRLEREERQERLVADRRKADDKAAKLAKHAAMVAKAAGHLGVSVVDPNWLLTPTRTPETRWVIMTPEVAERVLTEANDKNRRIRPWKVKRWVETYRSGNFSATHQGGAMDWNGICQDGQHRLKMIVEVGEPVEMQWTVGMDPANYAKIDSGLPRNLADLSHVQDRDRKYDSVVGGAARMIVLFDAHGSLVRSVRAAVSHEQVAAVLQEYGDELGEAATEAARIRQQGVKVSHPGLTTGIFLLRRRLPVHDSRLEAFLEDLRLGVPGGPNPADDPVYKLRRLYVRSTQSRQALTSWEVVGHMLKVWALRSTGKTAGNLRFAEGDPMPGVFLPPPKPVLFGGPDAGDETDVEDDD